MQRNPPIQFFSVIILIVLVLTFYMLLTADAIMEAGSLNFAESLFLIIIAIILLGIFSTLNKIEYNLRDGKKKK